jgi:hypothetical protein
MQTSQLQFFTARFFHEKTNLNQLFPSYDWFDATAMPWHQIGNAMAMPLENENENEIKVELY